MMHGLGIVLLIIAYEIVETYLRYVLGRWFSGWCERNSAWCRAAIRSKSVGTRP